MEKTTGEGKRKRLGEYISYLSSLSAWLRTNMPLLQTRSGDPWVKDVLRGLAGYSMTA